MGVGPGGWRRTGEGGTRSQVSYWDAAMDPLRPWLSGGLCWGSWVGGPLSGSALTAPHPPRDPRPSTSPCVSRPCSVCSTTSGHSVPASWGPPCWAWTTSTQPGGPSCSVCVPRVQRLGCTLSRWASASPHISSCSRLGSGGLHRAARARCCPTPPHGGQGGCGLILLGAGCTGDPSTSGGHPAPGAESLSSCELPGQCTPGFLGFRSQGGSHGT